MNIVEAAKNTLPLIEGAIRLPHYNNDYGRNHIQEMLEKIISGEITGEKSHRWLGWVQCAIVMGGNSSLTEMKQINKGDQNVG